MKKRTIMITLVVLGLLLLVGVGFAAWTITAPETNVAKTGNVTAYTVSTSEYTIAATFDNDNNNIIFGKPETMNAANPWLTADNSVAVENLSVVLTVTVTLTGVATLPATINVAVSDNFAGHTTVSNAKWSYSTDGTAWTDGSASIPQSAFAGSGTTYTCKVKVSYNWIDKAATPDTLNPYAYYNAKAYTSALATEASAYLTTVYNETNDKNITVTIGNATPAA